MTTNDTKKEAPMNITLPPEIAAIVIQQATEQGISTQDWLHQAIKDKAYYDEHYVEIPFYESLEALVAAEKIKTDKTKIDES